MRDTHNMLAVFTGEAEDGRVLSGRPTSRGKHAAYQPVLRNTTIFPSQLERYEPMNAISIENIDGYIVITTETTSVEGYLWWKKNVTHSRRFEAVERIAGDFWTWLELPHMTRVPDTLSFQLDAWKKYGRATHRKLPGGTA